jgi:hypothetical protein
VWANAPHEGHVFTVSGKALGEMCMWTRKKTIRHVRRACVLTSDGLLLRDTPLSA